MGEQERKGSLGPTWKQHIPQLQRESNLYFFFRKKVKATLGPAAGPVFFFENKVAELQLCSGK